MLFPQLSDAGQHLWIGGHAAHPTRPGGTGHQRFQALTRCGQLFLPDMDRLAIHAEVLPCFGLPMPRVEVDDLPPLLGHLVRAELAQAGQHLHAPPVAGHSIGEGETKHRHARLGPALPAHLIS